MRTALIVIDVQNYFMNEYTRDLPKKLAVHLETNTYDAVAFTQFINSPSSSFQKIFGWKKCTGSPEIDICDELKPWLRRDNVFSKNGFSAFQSAKLLAFLYQHGIQEVHLCGTDTDACVLASAFEGFEAGFRPRILYDLCASTNGREYHRYGGGYILEGVKDRLCTERVREYAHYTQPYAPPYNETIRLLLFQNGSYRVEGIFVADIAIEAQETCEENIVQDETLTENRPFDMDMQGEYSSTAQTLEGNGEFTNAAGFGALEPSNNWEVEWKFEFEKTPQEIAEESGQVNATTTASTPEESKPGEEAAPEENNTRLILVGVAVLIILLYLYLEKKEEA